MRMTKARCWPTIFERWAIWTDSVTTEALRMNRPRVRLRGFLHGNRIAAVFLRTARNAEGACNRRSAARFKTIPSHTKTGRSEASGRAKSGNAADAPLSGVGQLESEPAIERILKL